MDKKALGIGLALVGATLGVAAVVLSRKEKAVDGEFTIKLSSDSNGGLYFYDTAAGDIIEGISSASVPSGGDVYIAAVPADGYEISSVKDNGLEVSGLMEIGDNGIGGLLLENINEAHNIVARFVVKGGGGGGEEPGEGYFEVSDLSFEYGGMIPNPYIAYAARATYIIESDHNPNENITDEGSTHYHPREIGENVGDIMIHTDGEMGDFKVWEWDGKLYNLIYWGMLPRYDNSSSCVGIARAKIRRNSNIDLPSGVAFRIALFEPAGNPIRSSIFYFNDGFGFKYPVDRLVAGNVVDVAANMAYITEVPGYPDGQTLPAKTYKLVGYFEAPYYNEILREDGIWTVGDYSWAVRDELLGQGMTEFVVDGIKASAFRDENAATSILVVDGIIVKRGIDESNVPMTGCKCAEAAQRYYANNYKSIVRHIAMPVANADIPIVIG